MVNRARAATPQVAAAAARPGGARSILELYRRVPLPLHHVNG